MLLPTLTLDWAATMPGVYGGMGSSIIELGVRLDVGGGGGSGAIADLTGRSGFSAAASPSSSVGKGRRGSTRPRPQCERVPAKGRSYELKWRGIAEIIVVSQKMKAHTMRNFH